jgi:hypothetical protein
MLSPVFYAITGLVSPAPPRASGLRDKPDYHALKKTDIGKDSFTGLWEGRVPREQCEVETGLPLVWYLLASQG